MTNFKFNLLRDVVRSTKAPNNTRTYSSALFIPGNKANENFSYLTPHLDIDERFSNIDVLKSNIRARGLNYDIDDIKKSWDFLKVIDDNRRKIEDKRASVAHQIKKMGKNKDASPEDKKMIEGLFLQGKILKQELRSVKESLWSIEETVVPRILQLPNEIDEKTPETEATILKAVGDVSLENKSSKSHLEIGEALGMIDYTNPLHVYLENEAAHFEIAALAWASETLNDSKMLRIGGGDFAKSLVVEAAGLNHHNPFEAFHLENTHDTLNKEDNSRLHLIGGASLISFLAMHTKQLINPKNFPLRYFASGRQYVPAVPKPSSIGLFGACQASAVHSLTVVQKKSSPEHQEEFDKLVNTVTGLYNQLDIPYRVVLRSANQLKTWESLRISFELWSNYYGNFIEAGHISICGDFFSKRLLIAYQTPKGRDYPAIISGTVLSIHRLLACLLEQNEHKLIIPKCIREKMSL